MTRRYHFILAVSLLLLSAITGGAGAMIFVPGAIAALLNGVYMRKWVLPLFGLYCQALALYILARWDDYRLSAAASVLGLSVWTYYVISTHRKHRKTPATREDGIVSG